MLAVALLTNTLDLRCYTLPAKSYWSCWNHTELLVQVQHRVSSNICWNPVASRPWYWATIDHVHMLYNSLQVLRVTTSCPIKQKAQLRKAAAEPYNSKSSPDYLHGRSGISLQSREHPLEFHNGIEIYLISTAWASPLVTSAVCGGNLYIIVLWLPYNFWDY